MATIVRGSVPTQEFALNHTLAALPNAEVECERIIESGANTVMPLLWVRYADRADVDAALDEDQSVDSVSCLSEFDEECLYRMEWVDHVQLLLQMVTNSDATVLDAYGRKDRWKLRVLYPTRDEFAKTHDFAEDHGLNFDVESIREMDGEPAGRFGLSEDQFRSLVLAAQRGYYEVPRRTSLTELADEMDISHQALSERLRRGMEALVEDTLLVGAVPEDLQER
ncbi:helix-turn-helix domain-containing protein [Haloferax sp. DFSO52]|uniref:helix-turn-helix domain-containing protein n=1 Tax=Haloferax sp. DFSO52 TaxID=3388505 RepID=UPI003A867791